MKNYQIIHFDIFVNIWSTNVDQKYCRLSMFFQRHINLIHEMFDSKTSEILSKSRYDSYMIFY